MQAELRRQEEALIAGTAHDGACPHCGQTRRLFRYQPPVQPWHSPDYTPPARWLCVDGWNASADQDNALLHSALAEATPAA